MDAWDRSQFAMTGPELDLEDAVKALRRLLAHREITPATRQALGRALDALREEVR